MISRIAAALFFLLTFLFIFLIAGMQRDVTTEADLRELDRFYAAAFSCFVMALLFAAFAEIKAELVAIRKDNARLARTR